MLNCEYRMCFLIHYSTFSIRYSQFKTHNSKLITYGKSFFDKLVVGQLVNNGY